MINDRRLQKISLVISIIGIAAIFITSALSGPQEFEIKDITEDMAGRNVVVNGTIISYNINNGNIFIELSDKTGNITAIMFERTARGHSYNLKRGDNVTIGGQVNIYKNELEIIANSISKDE